MAAAEQHIGIANNKDIMDMLYAFYKKYPESPLNMSSNQTEEERVNNKISAGINYLGLVFECIEKVTIGSEKYEHDEAIRSDFLDWLRWNRDIIDDNLVKFNQDPEIISNIDNARKTITTAQKRIDDVFTQNFNVTPQEKGIVSEYLQAYRIASGRSQQDKKTDLLYIQAGRLFINYLQILISKRYITKYARDPDVTKEVLEAEAAHLIGKLFSINSEVYNDVKGMWNAYNDFIENDKNAAMAQDVAIKEGIEKAHSRASESMLQSAIRNIRETIQEIRKALASGINNIFTASRAVLTFSDIRKAFHNIRYAVTHPLDTGRLVLNWIQENPGKTALFVFAGIAIGVVTGGAGVGIVIGAGFGIAATAATTAAVAMAVGITVTAVVATVPMLSAAGEAAQLERIARENIREKETEIDQKRNEVHTEGEEISLVQLEQRHIRESLRKAREQAEIEAKILREAEMAANRFREQQLRDLSMKDLKEKEAILTGALGEVSEEEKAIKLHRKELEESFRQIQEDTFTIRQSRAASERIARLHAKNYSYSFSDGISRFGLISTAPSSLSSSRPDSSAEKKEEEESSLQK